jgi:hypothetical protein
MKRVYWDPMFVAIAIGILFTLAWQALYLPTSVLVAFAVMTLAVSAYGYRRTQREAAR